MKSSIPPLGAPQKRRWDPAESPVFMGTILTMCFLIVVLAIAVTLLVTWHIHPSFAIAIVAFTAGMALGKGLGLK